MNNDLLRNIDSLILGKVICAMLTDIKILLISSHACKLAPFIETMIELINTIFEWNSIVIPAVGENTIDFIDAPVPYVIGIQ
jgi:hypothetical protein